MKPLLFLIALPILASFAPSPVVGYEEGGVEVGPSVLMNARARCDAAIFDLRLGGRLVPDALPAARFSPREKRAVFLLGSSNTCKHFASAHRLQSYFIVPPHMIEYEPVPGVPQLSPLQTQQKVESGQWPLFDISEEEEFVGSHLPRSIRLNYGDFQHSSLLPRHKPFIVACRVGHRSQLVVQKLRSLGYNAHNLDGGLWAWECAGLPLEKS